MSNIRKYKGLRQEDYVIPRCLSVPAAAIYLGISPSGVRSLASEMAIEPLRIGGRVLFDRLDLDEFIEKIKKLRIFKKREAKQSDQDSGSTQTKGGSYDKQKAENEVQKIMEGLI